jgi:hypothetical protein
VRWTAGRRGNAARRMAGRRGSADGGAALFCGTSTTDSGRAARLGSRRVGPAEWWREASADGGRRGGAAAVCVGGGNWPSDRSGGRRQHWLRRASSISARRCEVWAVGEEEERRGIYTCTPLVPVGGSNRD